MVQRRLLEMNIKVTIEFTDEFDQKLIAVSGIENADVILYDNQLEFIFMFIKQAVVGLGFTNNTIEDFLNGKEED